MPSYLICYDIADPKRLGRVHRITVNYAFFIQYSVYYYKGETGQLHLILDELSEVISDTLDDIRVYQITSFESAIFLGRSWLPEEITLIGK